MSLHDTSNEIIVDFPKEKKYKIEFLPSVGKAVHSKVI